MSKKNKLDIFTGWEKGAYGPPECHINTSYAKKFKNYKEKLMPVDENDIKDDIKQAEKIWADWPDPASYIYYKEQSKNKIPKNKIPKWMDEAYQKGAEIKNAPKYSDYFSGTEPFKDFSMSSSYQKNLNDLNDFSSSTSLYENLSSVDQDEYLEKFATKINKGINYSLNIHTTKKGKKFTNQMGDTSVYSYVKKVCVKHMASCASSIGIMEQYDSLIEDKNGKLFVIEILFNIEPFHFESIVYDFENDRYLSIERFSISVADDKEHLRYTILHDPLPYTKDMDLLDWFLVRKAIYLERFSSDKLNIKDVYDPVVLGLSSIYSDMTNNIDLFLKKDEDDDFDLIDLD